MKGAQLPLPPMASDTGSPSHQSQSAPGPVNLPGTIPDPAQEQALVRAEHGQTPEELDPIPFSPPLECLGDSSVTINHFTEMKEVPERLRPHVPIDRKLYQRAGTDEFYLRQDFQGKDTICGGRLWFRQELARAIFNRPSMIVHWLLDPEEKASDHLRTILNRLGEKEYGSKLPILNSAYVRIVKMLRGEGSPSTDEELWIVDKRAMTVTKVDMPQAKFKDFDAIVNIKPEQKNRDDLKGLLYFRGSRMLFPDELSQIQVCLGPHRINQYGVLMPQVFLVQDEEKEKKDKESVDKDKEKKDKEGIDKDKEPQVCLFQQLIPNGNYLSLYPKTPGKDPKKVTLEGLHNLAEISAFFLFMNWPDLSEKHVSQVKVGEELHLVVGSNFVNDSPREHKGFAKRTPEEMRKALTKFPQWGKKEKKDTMAPGFEACPGFFWKNIPTGGGKLHEEAMRNDNFTYGIYRIILCLLVAQELFPSLLMSLRGKISPEDLTILADEAQANWELFVDVFREGVARLHFSNDDSIKNQFNDFELQEAGIPGDKRVIRPNLFTLQGFSCIPSMDGTIELGDFAIHMMNFLLSSSPRELFDPEGSTYQSRERARFLSSMACVHKDLCAIIGRHGVSLKDPLTGKDARTAPTRNESTGRGFTLKRAIPPQLEFNVHTCLTPPPPLALSVPHVVASVDVQNQSPAQQHQQSAQTFGVGGPMSLMPAVVHRQPSNGTVQVTVESKDRERRSIWQRCSLV